MHNQILLIQSHACLLCGGCVCVCVQEFGPTGKEGKLMLPHPAGNDNGRNILQVRSAAAAAAAAIGVQAYCGQVHPLTAAAAAATAQDSLMSDLPGQ
jgi:hypothetical protein